MFKEFPGFEITQKGGLKNMDYLLKWNDTTIKIDFKFNCSSIDKYPQLVDLHSYKLGSSCYATFFYTHYISVEGC